MSIVSSTSLESPDLNDLKTSYKSLGDNKHGDLSTSKIKQNSVEAVGLSSATSKSNNSSNSVSIQLSESQASQKSLSINNIPLSASICGQSSSVECDITPMTYANGTYIDNQKISRPSESAETIPDSIGPENAFLSQESLAEHTYISASGSGSIHGSTHGSTHGSAHGSTHVAISDPNNLEDSLNIPPQEMGREPSNLETVFGTSVSGSTLSSYNSSTGESLKAGRATSIKSYNSTRKLGSATQESLFETVSLPPQDTDYRALESHSSHGGPILPSIDSDVLQSSGESHTMPKFEEPPSTKSIAVSRLSASVQPACDETSQLTSPHITVTLSTHVGDNVTPDPTPSPHVGDNVMPDPTPSPHVGDNVTPDPTFSKSSLTGSTLSSISSISSMSQ